MKHEIMTILFIDDEKRKVHPLMDALINLGHTVDYRDNPDDGIAAASHHYNLIFVDFTFEMSDKDGTDIGMELRKKCSLVPLVLLTAYGKEKIRDFIYVGFDDYFDKHIEGERVTDKKRRLVNCLEVAIANSQKRIKSIFSEDELKLANLRLDAIEHALSLLLTNRTDENIVRKVNDYEKGIDSAAKPITRSRLLTFFSLYEKGRLNEDALKVRQLLIENPTSKWPETRKAFKKVSVLIKEFNIHSL
jgi:DNA-binding response OmpR family regulator